MHARNRPVALITGASAGIGAELAREFARHGHDLILTARSIDPMERLAADLRDGGAAVTVIGADLSQPGAAACLVEKTAETELPIDVLVNNAGLGGAGRFDHISATRVSEMLQVNIVALTELTRLILPDMIARRRGKVMLVGSVAGFQPGPGMAVYFATKAYVLSLGEALAYELRGTGVDVSVLCPGATATKFFEAAGATNRTTAQSQRRMMRADGVARIGYRGLMAGRTVVIAGLVNRILALGGRFGPHRVTLPIASSLMAENDVKG